MPQQPVDGGILREDAPPLPKSNGGRFRIDWRAALTEEFAR